MVITTNLTPKRGIVRKIRRECVKCQAKYVPTGKHSRFCDDCLKESKRLVMIKRRAYG